MYLLTYLITTCSPTLPQDAIERLDSREQRARQQEQDLEVEVENL